MFEASLIAAQPAIDSSGGLRPLAWGELVARLTAAHDVRALLARPNRMGGSFAPLVATGLVRGRGERGVNLEALASGKSPAGNCAAAVHTAAIGERDN